MSQNFWLHKLWSLIFFGHQVLILLLFPCVLLQQHFCFKLQIKFRVFLKAIVANQLNIFSLDLYGLGCVFYWSLNQIFNCCLFRETKGTYNYLFIFFIKQPFQKTEVWIMKNQALFTQYCRLSSCTVWKDVANSVSQRPDFCPLLSFLLIPAVWYMFICWMHKKNKAQNLKIHFPCHPSPPPLPSAFLLYFFPLGKWKRTWETERELRSCSENEMSSEVWSPFRAKHLQVRSVFPAAELNTKSRLLLSCILVCRLTPFLWLISFYVIND